MTKFLPFDVPPMDAPIRFAGATRKPRKAGGWLVKASIKCADFVPIDDIVDYLAKVTNVSEWISDDGEWDGKDFTWNLIAITD